MEYVIIVTLAYAVAIYLRYLQWLSDDRNFEPEYRDFDEWMNGYED